MRMVKSMRLNVWDFLVRSFYCRGGRVECFITATAAVVIWADKCNKGNIIFTVNTHLLSCRNIRVCNARVCGNSPLPPKITPIIPDLIPLHAFVHVHINANHVFELPCRAPNAHGASIIKRIYYTRISVEFQTIKKYIIRERCLHRAQFPSRARDT